MTSLAILNDTTKNLIKALEEYKPLPSIVYIFKAVYNDTGKVTELTYADTDKQHIIISKEEYEKFPFIDRLYVIDGKLIEKQKSYYVNRLALIEGNRWYTSKSNMLIMGNERGWDERRNS